MGESDAMKSQKMDVMSRIRHMKTRVDRVHVDGLQRTNHQLVRRQLLPLLDAADYEQLFAGVQSVREQLIQLGCFSSVSALIDTSSGSRATHRGVEVTFEVQELSRVKGGVRTEVGQNEGSMSVMAELPNVLGNGESCQLQYQRGSRKSSGFDATMRKPLHDSKNTVLSVSAMQTNNEFQPSQFSQLNRSALFKLATNPLTNVCVTAEYEASWRQLRPLHRTTCPLAVLEHAGPSLLSAVKLTLTRDTRDSRLLPASGTLFSWRQDFAGLGGNVRFWRNCAEMQFNWTLGCDITFQTALRAGFILSPQSVNAIVSAASPAKTGLLTSVCRRLLADASVELPDPSVAVSLSDRFYLGGALDVRGFSSRRLGPAVDGAYVGADAFWASGVHVFCPLPFRPGGGGFGELFRSHAFLTAGNLFNILCHESRGLCDWDDVWRNTRLSCGIGLCLRLGESARVELSYCLPLRKTPTDGAKTGLQLGLGVDFL